MIKFCPIRHICPIAFTLHNVRHVHNVHHLRHVHNLTLVIFKEGVSSILLLWVLLALMAFLKGF